MRFSAATFPRATPAIYLNEVQLGRFNCVPYSGSRLQILAFGVAYVSVAIADCHRGSKLHAPTGIRHSLHHIYI
jgi:hypothetical protein